MNKMDVVGKVADQRESLGGRGADSSERFEGAPPDVLILVADEGEQQPFDIARVMVEATELIGQLPLGVEFPAE